MIKTFELERAHTILSELKSRIVCASAKVRTVYISDQKLDDINHLSDIVFRPFSDREDWGGRDLYKTFKVEVTTPEWADGLPYALYIDTGHENAHNAQMPQLLVYVNGKVKQGHDTNHCRVLLSESAKAGEKYTLICDAWSGYKAEDSFFRVKEQALRRDVEKLYYDLLVACEAAAILDVNDKNRVDMIKVITQAVNLLDLRKIYSCEFDMSIAEAGKYVAENFYDRFKGNSITLHAIATTHIDVAWRWTLSHTRLKTARSISTALDIMDRYPEYTFSFSQPQLYQYLKNDYPDIYKQVIDKIKEGRFDPEGAMWLEADCNLTSGEGFVRQLLYGKKFFKEELGRDSSILWLPDVFGYSPALPQILKRSGVDCFITSKISWNEYNRVPYDTFNWKGIDGTEILTHFHTMPSKGQSKDKFHTTYNGKLFPEMVSNAWNLYQQKEMNSEIMCSYGYGDGGGGPTSEMVEYGKRLTEGLPNVPKVKFSSMTEFADALKKSVNGKKLPKWVGELYLEYHRGTYTTMARNKKYNRQSEFRYQKLEEVSSIADVLLKTDNYPKHQIDKGWGIILLNQFHDILPGSSIKEVYEESKEQYEEILGEADKNIMEKYSAITSNISLSSNSVVVFNQLGNKRSDIAEFKYDGNVTHVKDEDGNIHTVQKTVSGNHIFIAENIPAFGYRSYEIVNSTNAAGKRLLFEDRKISNDFYDILFDEEYNIVSLYDKKADREVVKAGCKANELLVYEDRPHQYDAWDINIYYNEKEYKVNDVVSAKLTENGPVRACIEVVRKFLDSTIKQNIYIYTHVPRIEFDNEIDWKESHLLLKASFPVDISAVNATYDIQFGNIERPTHYNTSWDAAKFEVCGHKWVDLSEGNYGVSLLNDCKYGYDINDNVMRMTLLRSPTEPNPIADKEVHKFKYAILPHDGNWRDGGTEWQAFGLNCPFDAVVAGPSSGELAKEYSFLETESDNVVVETLKRSEDANGFIVRLYDFKNSRSNIRIKFNEIIKAVYECNLIEENESEIIVTDNECNLVVKPYEIKTLRVILG